MEGRVDKINTLHLDSTWKQSGAVRGVDALVWSGGGDLLNDAVSRQESRGGEKLLV